MDIETAEDYETELENADDNDGFMTTLLKAVHDRLKIEVAHGGADVDKWLLPLLREEGSDW